MSDSLSNSSSLRLYCRICLDNVSISDARCFCCSSESGFGCTGFDSGWRFFLPIAYPSSIHAPAIILNPPQIRINIRYPLPAASSAYIITSNPKTIPVIPLYFRCSFFSFLLCCKVSASSCPDGLAASFSSVSSGSFPAKHAFQRTLTAVNWLETVSNASCTTVFARNSCASTCASRSSFASFPVLRLSDIWLIASASFLFATS